MLDVGLPPLFSTQIGLDSCAAPNLHQIVTQSLIFKIGSATAVFDFLYVASSIYEDLSALTGCFPRNVSCPSIYKIQETAS